MCQGFSHAFPFRNNKFWAPPATMWDLPRHVDVSSLVWRRNAKMYPARLVPGLAALGKQGLMGG